MHVFINKFTTVTIKQVPNGDIFLMSDESNQAYVKIFKGHTECDDGLVPCCSLQDGSVRYIDEDMHVIKVKAITITVEGANE